MAGYVTSRSNKPSSVVGIVAGVEERAQPTLYFCLDLVVLAGEFTGGLLESLAVRLHGLREEPELVLRKEPNARLGEWQRDRPPVRRSLRKIFSGAEPPVLPARDPSGHHPATRPPSTMARSCFARPVEASAWAASSVDAAAVSAALTALDSVTRPI